MKNYFSLAPIFTDNMILQRDEPVAFYGETGAHMEVELISNQGKWQTVADSSGKFRLEVGPFLLEDTFQFQLISGECKIELKNVLFGDVYLAAGQSNMEYPLVNDLEVTQETINWSKIRFYNVPQIEYSGHEMPQNVWGNANEQMSAVAYYFAVKLHLENPEIPIGIIGCYKGGTSASCWLSEDVLTANEQLKKTYIEPFAKAIMNKSELELDVELKAFEEKSRAFVSRKEQYMIEHPELTLKEVKEKFGHSPWPPPMTPKSYGRPAGLYQTMFQTIIGVRFRAVLWYQGEEDVQFGYVYEELLKLLIEEWRRDLEMPSLPFFIVQLPKYANAPEGSWPIIREIQENITKNVPGTYLITTIDTGEAFDIHPPAKRVIGERLAFVVKRVLKDSAPSATPTIQTVERKKSQLWITISNTKELTVIGECLFNCADVEVEGASLIVSLGNNQKFCYAFENFPTGYLVNEEGLPVSPFELAMK